MRWLLALVLVAFVTGTAQAASLQASLIRASNELPADPALKQLQPQLKAQFGYKNYKLLGNKKEVLKPATAHKLDVGEGFCVIAILKSTVKDKTARKDVHELTIEWMSGKTKLLTAPSVKMSEGAHVLIKGPAVGNDWIVLALTVTP
jgi:hypothetical protein